MDNEKRITVSMEDIKNIINDSIANAINIFGYEEFLREISGFNIACVDCEELLNEFSDTEPDEDFLDKLECVTDEIQLLEVEYAGFNKEEIVVLGCKGYRETKELTDEAICHCQLITNYYTEISENLRLDGSTDENHISAVYDTIIDQRDVFNTVMFAFGNIKFKDKIDEVTNLNSLDDDAKKRCIVGFNEMYGNIIGGLDFFDKNNNIKKVYEYIKDHKK